jgi:hypothetical protein
MSPDCFASSDIFAASTPPLRERPLGDGSACPSIRLTLESLLTSGLPRMELAKCFEQFALFHFCYWEQGPFSIALKQPHKH